MMNDPDLEAIRQRRMQEIMTKQGGQMGGVPTGAGGGDPQQQAAEAEEQARAAEDQRRQMMAALMTSEARERLSRIALVKPEKAQGVENMILAAAKRGQLAEKVTEERLVSMLETINERAGGSKTKVIIQRRRPMFEDDD